MVVKNLSTKYGEVHGNDHDRDVLQYMFWKRVMEGKSKFIESVNLLF